jgi:hypothetical protein
MAVFAQGFGLVLNLVPPTYAQGGRAVATDGRAIVDALRGSPVPRPQLVRLQPAASPLCARCGRGRDEQADQPLSSTPCDCAATPACGGAGTAGG